MSSCLEGETRERRPSFLMGNSLSLPAVRQSPGLWEPSYHVVSCGVMGEAGKEAACTCEIM